MWETEKNTHKNLRPDHRKRCGVCQYISSGLCRFRSVFSKKQTESEISEAAKLKEKLDSRVKSVAVTVSPTVEQVGMIQKAGFDYIQIHGSLDPEVYEAVRLPVLRAFNVSDMDAFGEMSRLDKIAGYIFDSKNPGSGETFDWSLMDQIPRDGRLLFLAGGSMRAMCGKPLPGSAPTALM